MEKRVTNCKKCDHYIFISSNECKCGHPGKKFMYPDKTYQTYAQLFMDCPVGGAHSVIADENKKETNI